MGGRDFALVAEIHTVPLYLLCSCTINVVHFISLFYVTDYLVPQSRAGGQR